MVDLKPHLLRAIRSSLAYGLGLGLAIVITGILYAAIDYTQAGLRIPSELLFIGFGIAFLIEGIGAGIGGAIGGMTLSLPPGKERSRWGKAWRSGLSMGLLFSLVLFLFIFIIFLLVFYSRYELDWLKFGLMFVVAGALFGGLFALLLGSLLIRKHGVWWVGLAGFIGFGIGGFGLGAGLYRYLLTLETANVQSGNRIWLIGAFVIFGLVGGAALGFVFSYLSDKVYLPQKSKWWHWALAGVIFLLILGAAWPVLAAFGDMLTPNDADLDVLLDSNTISTHWSDGGALSRIVALGGSPQKPVIAANDNGQLAQAWSQVTENGSDIVLLPGTWQDNRAVWQTPINVTNNLAPTDNPQIAIDSVGNSHIVWEEAGAILYSQCQREHCLPPMVLSNVPACAPSASIHTTPSLAIDEADSLMVVWQTHTGQLLYRNLSVSGQPADNAVDCVTTETIQMSQPRLDATTDSHFALVFVGGDDAIYTMTYADGQWGSLSPVLGNGRSPNILLDAQNDIHLAWCNDADELIYAVEGSQQTASPFACSGRPEMVLDNEGTLHLIWYGDEVVDGNGRFQPNNLLYESTLVNGAWTEPAIIQRTGIPGQPAVAATDSHIHLVWPQSTANGDDLAIAHFEPYSCEAYPPQGISQTAYNVARGPQYRPQEDLIPYCQNQVHQLVHMPNPDPAFSDETPNPNGGFDEFAQLAQTAQYEVLFTTMWYEADQNQDSPGYVVAESVAVLYEKLKANPEAYPRGLTVRILTGNPPQLNLQPFSDQSYSVLANLRKAGVDKLVDPEIGWRVEVADFDGAMPHSHTKFMVVDGKSALVAGFNMEYKHYAVDHPSGLGESKQDLGISVTGPVVQNTQRAFDDLWEGSVQTVCSDFYPPHGIWQLTCRQETAVVDHVPEVLKYYVPDADSHIFSMYRSKNHDEADSIVGLSLGAAQNQVDAMHVMFSMEAVCDLNLLFELCDFGEATEYLEGLMQAAENGAHIRLIIYPKPLNGIESSVAYDVFLQELEDRGLRDQVEIRFLEELLHYKTTLIDDEYLVIGSQNFHYSAYGQEDGLSEYGLGTNDPEAIADYQRLFEYQWERSVQR